MGGEGETDTSQARVQTYVPKYQKDDWKAAADRMDMSLSEFVRSMVQAGKRGFSADEETVESSTGEEPREGQHSDADPQGRRLEERVLSLLADGESYDWEEIVAAVTDDIEEQLDETLQELQADDEIRYSGRDGGYVRK